MGSSLYSYIKNNKLENSGSSITEGIGTGRITKNFEKALVDEAFQINDTEAFEHSIPINRKSKNRFRWIFGNKYFRCDQISKKKWALEKL